jgi:hypothetical protein
MFLSVFVACTWAKVVPPEPGQYHRYRAARANSMLSIVPVDGAEFLPNQLFDVSIELHDINGQVPPNIDSLKATIDGKPITEMFKKPMANESWFFKYFSDASSFANNQSTTVAVSRLALRSIKLPSPGVYQVQVQVGNHTASAEWIVRKIGPRLAKNLVLMIGDGMAPTMISAARYLSKPTNFGKFGNNFLNIERLGSIGKIATNGLDSIITDSANSAASYLSGHKQWVQEFNLGK